MSERYKIQVRKGTLSDWTSSNPTLSMGELAFVTDMRQLKVGDGVTDFNSLKFVAFDGGNMDPTDLGTTPAPPPPTTTTTTTTTPVPVANLYFRGGNWGNLSNWFYNWNLNVPADSLPDVYQDVVVKGSITGGDYGSVRNILFLNNSSLGPMELEVGDTATFNGSSRNYGFLVGNARFNDSSWNTGTVNGNAKFYGSSHNDYIVQGNATFYDYAFNWVTSGYVQGNATFNNQSVNIGGYVLGDATFNDSSRNNFGGSVGNATFNSAASNFSNVRGNATFNQSSANWGVVYGDAIFNGTSFNLGAVAGSVTCNTTSGNCTPK